MDLLPITRDTECIRESLILRVVTSDHKMRNSFYLGYKQISDIQKYSINILVASEHSISLLRMGEGSNVPSVCEGVK